MNRINFAMVLVAILVVACDKKPDAIPGAASVSASASSAPTAPAWKPHKLSENNASIFCSELREGGITTECAGGPGASDTDVFLIPGRARTEASGVIVSFNAGGSFEQWIAESLAGDAGVDPVYHYAQRAKMLVFFKGDVPEATKLRVAEALDAL